MQVPRAERHVGEFPRNSRPRLGETRLRVVRLGLADLHMVSAMSQALSVCRPQTSVGSIRGTLTRHHPEGTRCAFYMVLPWSSYWS
jgi:hypothetical protein